MFKACFQVVNTRLPKGLKANIRKDLSAIMVIKLQNNLPEILEFFSWVRFTNKRG